MRNLYTFCTTTRIEEKVNLNKKIIQLFLFLFTLTPFINAQDNSSKNTYSMSLQELWNLEVTSASNMKEKLSEAPANVIIITQEDIKNGGGRFKYLMQVF